MESISKAHEISARTFPNKISERVQGFEKAIK